MIRAAILVLCLAGCSTSVRVQGVEATGCEYIRVIYETERITADGTPVSLPQ